MDFKIREGGKPPPTNTDEFLEKFQKGGGSFPIHKIVLQNFLYIGDTFDA